MYDNRNNLGASSTSCATSDTGDNSPKIAFPDGTNATTELLSSIDSPLSFSSSAVDLGNFNWSPTSFVDPDTSINPLPDVTEVEHVDESQPNDPCDCAAKALDILQTISRSQLCSSWSATRRPSSSDTLATNKQSAEDIIGLLACPRCTSDRFLLATSLMIAMKLLERYASVAASWGSSTSNVERTANGSYLSTLGIQGFPTGAKFKVSGAMNRTTSNTSVEITGDIEEVPPREAIQSVLRELHRVQRLIAQLPGRLTSHNGQQATTNVFDGTSFDQQRKSSVDLLKGIVPTPPLSTRALSQVEDDVRTSLKELSANLRNSLNCC